ncbi:DHH family phosphoesterase [Candidatus Bathyarchaeota archaeon]|nr:DHH family phosphoesterase [Candidatus Bathyarchaeota archaeon]
MLESYRKFFDEAAATAEKIRQRISAGSTILVAGHFDADGLAAAGVLAKALYREGARFHVSVLKQLDPETVDHLSNLTPETIILADIGSGYLELLGGLARSKEIFILDHHQTEGECVGRFTHLNPHLYNIDGGKEVSGAGVAYLVAKAMNRGNQDLAVLAVVGAVGDMQDKNEGRALRGFNSHIVEDGVEGGYLRVDADLLMYGRETRPIHKALSHTVNPFLPGLSGEEDNCLAMLSSLSIPVKDGDRWRAPVELTTEEKKMIMSAIVENIISKGLEGAVAMNLVGSVYTLLKEEKWTPTRDAREYAALLNACGRMGRPSVALAICMGERGSTLAEANQILSEHRRALAGYMSMIRERPGIIENLESVCIIHGEDFLDENMTGAVSSLISSSEVLATDKVVLVLAKTKSGDIKISARATERLVEKGLNLGLVLQQNAKKHGGFGGGHRAAAGAQIPRSKLREYVEDLNKNLLGTLR